MLHTHNTHQKNDINTNIPIEKKLLSEKNWQVVLQMNKKFPREKGKSLISVDSEYKFIGDIDLTPLLIMKSFDRLYIGKDYAHFIDISEWVKYAPTLQTLVLCTGSSVNIEFKEIGKKRHLLLIWIDNYLNQHIEWNKLPKYMKYFSIGRSYNHPIDVSLFPDNMRVFQIGPEYEHKLDLYAMNRLTNLVEFSTGRLFNKPLDLKDMPKGMFVFKVGYNYNHEISLVDMPTNMKVFYMGINYGYYKKNELIIVPQNLNNAPKVFIIESDKYLYESMLQIDHALGNQDIYNNIEHYIQVGKSYIYRTITTRVNTLFKRSDIYGPLHLR
jgi:hypothetical protein